MTHPATAVRTSARPGMATTTATATATSTPRPSADLSVDSSVDTSVDGSIDVDDGDGEESPSRDGRSENSLAVLCQRFCALYRDHPDPINIDHAAKELGIQRRRMYEILNIIQSVGLVVRLRASFYRWQGQESMTTTLERLKVEGMARQEDGNPDGGSSAASKPTGASREGQRKKAVATALGERFVQIFLCNEVPQPIVLEDIMGLFTACMGGALTNQMSCARRLYDIANVFCAVGLIAKSCSSATDHRRKKRLYSWIGPVLPLSTPVRPHRLIAAPSVSPGSSSAKRNKSESSRVIQRRSKKIKSSLEESIVKAEASSSDSLGQVGATLTHPARLTLGSSVTAAAATLSRGLGTIPRSNTGNIFFPINAKDGDQDDDLLQAPPVSQPGTISAAQSVKMEQMEPTATEGEASEPTPNDEDWSDLTPAALRAKVVGLTKDLDEARARERELLKRIEAQDTQISKLLEATHPTRKNSLSSSHTAYAASPLTSFLLSPRFQRDPFTSTGATPSPLTDFSTGLTGSGCCRRVLDNPRVAETLNDPRCTSPKASLLSAQRERSASFGKPPTVNRHASISTPQRPKTQDNDVLSTPSSHLIAAAASSLLSLTPSQIPTDSSAIDLLAQFSPRHEKESDPARTVDSKNNLELAVSKSSSTASSSTRQLSSCVFESPSSLKTTFDGISPLPKSCFPNVTT